MNNTTWNHGWLGRADRRNSPNFSPRPPGAEVSLAVIHAISLPPGEYGGPAIEQLFTNQLNWDAHPYFGQIRGLQVSAHFVILRSGELQQYVSCDERAWHAGKSTWRGRADCNNYSVGIELEGLEGGRFEDAQYDGVVQVLNDLAHRYPLNAVAGHEHIAPGRKRDPGAGFEWMRLIDALGWPDGFFPPAVIRRD